MGINNYGKIERGRRKKLRRRVTVTAIAAAALLILIGTIGILAGDTEGYRNSSALVRENHELKARIAELEEENGELQMQILDRDEYINSIPAPEQTPYAPEIGELPAPTEEADMLESPRE